MCLNVLYHLRKNSESLYSEPRSVTLVQRRVPVCSRMDAAHVQEASEGTGVRSWALVGRCLTLALLPCTCQWPVVASLVQRIWPNGRKTWNSRMCTRPGSRFRVKFLCATAIHRPCCGMCFNRVELPQGFKWIASKSSQSSGCRQAATQVNVCSLISFRLSVSVFAHCFSFASINVHQQYRSQASRWRRAEQ